MAARPILQSLSTIILALFVVAAAAPAAQASAPLWEVCYNAVINSSFETRDGWQLGGGLLPPQYVNWPVRSGLSAMQAGNVNQPNNNAFSNFRQTLNIPTNATSAQLSFWVWTQAEPNPGTDRQELLLLIPGANVQTFSGSAIWTAPQPNSGIYQEVRLDLNSQIGRYFDLAFSVYNDGAGGRSAMFIDDVTLTVCQPTTTPSPLPSATPWPSATPTTWPTATAIPTPIVPSPIPPNCVDILANGDFEWDGAWQLGGTPLTPFYAGPPNPAHSGNRSMALGAILPGASNAPSYSSVQQPVTIPATAQTAQIRFWYYPSSTATAGGLNRQELVLLDPLNFGETVAVPWRVTENANSWLYREEDLTAYRGRTLSIYFNARNAGDGTRTAMFLDQVAVLVCDPVVAVPASEAPIAPQQALPAETAPPVLLLASPAAIAQPTRLSVEDQPAAAPAIAAPAAAAAAAENTRGEQESIFGDLLDSPWLILLVSSVVFVLAVIVALLVFGGNKGRSGSND